jgi:hypothetical protein
METITNAAGSFGYLLTALIGAAIMWGLDRWYYTRDGRARVKEAEEKLKELEARAKAQGIILRE